MSLITCPECGHEVSSAAVACANCGKPFAAVTTPRITRTIERNTVVPVARRTPFPAWIFIPIVIIGGGLVFLLFAMMKTENQENANLRANAAESQKSSDLKETRRTETTSKQTDIPAASTTINQTTTTAPPTVPPASKTVPPASSQTVPPASQTDVVGVPADKGSVVIDAKVSNKNGNIQTVKNEKFYLLDKDLETILAKANLEPIDGQSLSNSFGLAVLYPERYNDFNREALNEIKKHVKYDAITDGTGKASMKDVKPDSYYLFGITKTRTGFAIWSSPVSIIGGENKLNLAPATMNEISE